jgi:hypothetical protein
MNPPTADRRVLVSVPERYVAGADTQGRQEGLQYPWSQQVIHEISWFTHWFTDIVRVAWEACRD